ncbi:hypothetical protein FA95DRAFT_1613861 [Auriscalpium vulgare]|uniref:Uncharacterized protein n=1 Tax=Auriscalpium vulgare TaxID=40419 RepID=A0ACB8R150_9AGAM|nr:hypothetical protein FA95DRAFT_1613861 [Auriscalpium vulgare]
MRINSTENSAVREARKRAERKKRRAETTKKWGIGVPGSSYVWKNGMVAWDPELADYRVKCRKRIRATGDFWSRRAAPRRPGDEDVVPGEDFNSVPSVMKEILLAAGPNGDEWHHGGWGSAGGGAWENAGVGGWGEASSGGNAGEGGWGEASSAGSSQW